MNNLTKKLFKINKKKIIYVGFVKMSPFNIDLRIVIVKFIVKNVQ
jgi:hypothetical protein